MKVVFVSNYINHHQIPFSDEMYKKLNGNYIFIQTEPMEEERIRMGWGVELKQIPYLRLFYEEEEACRRSILDSDLVIFGGTEREELLRPRLRAGRPVIRYSERLYREGQWKAVSPRGLLHKYNDHTKYRGKNVWLLCSGGYVASDFQLVRAYPGKMLKWGYFPQFKKFTEGELPNETVTEELRVLWAGRFLPLKHPEYAVLAAKRLRSMGTPFRIDMVGAGEREEEIRRMLREEGLEDRVSLHGFLPPERVRGMMENAHIFLFTSNRLEGWGAVLNEAMNSGCAVTAGSAAGAVPFLLRHGENGLVYRDGDEAEFLDYVERLASDGELRKRLGRQAYRTVERLWNPARAASALLSFAEGALEGRPRMAEEGPCSPAPVIWPGKGYDYTHGRKGG